MINKSSQIIPLGGFPEMDTILITLKETAVVVSVLQMKKWRLMANYPRYDGP